MVVCFYLHFSYFNYCILCATTGTVCQYEAYFGFDLNGSAAWEYEASGVSIADCMAKCEAVGCLEILYDNSSFTCRVADKRQRISVQLGSSVYYYRQCTKVTGG